MCDIVVVVNSDRDIDIEYKLCVYCLMTRGVS